MPGGAILDFKRLKCYQFVTPSYKGVKAYESPGGDLFSGAVAMDGTRGYIRKQWSDGVMG